jgi:small subunit ribosomal protein S14
MAKTSAKEKNLKRKNLTTKFAAKRLALKVKISDKALSFEERFALVQQLAELPRNSSKTRVRNRCVVTGRPRAYYRKFGVCRNALRELSAVGLIPGVIKSSW